MGFALGRGHRLLGAVFLASEDSSFVNGTELFVDGTPHMASRRFSSSTARCPRAASISCGPRRMTRRLMPWLGFFTWGITQLIDVITDKKHKIAGLQIG